MNTNFNSNYPDGLDASLDSAPTVSDPPEALCDRMPTAPPVWQYWVKRLLVCNPFFLCSAALLLFAINQLSVDPNFLPDEQHNLLFNFSALQLYEVLLVTTALLLSRRHVWYDSSLLVVLENGLVLVPFMLISQAALIGSQLAWALTLAGGAVAAGRFLTLRRFYPKFNLPSRALLFGAIILLANVALPRVFRPWIEQDVADWRIPNLVLWYLVLPLFAAGANLLPRPLRYGGLCPERHWLPLFIYGLWIAASAVHVWCLAHICSLPFAPELLGPLTLVCFWTLYNRLHDCQPKPSLYWKSAILLLTFVAPLLSVAQPFLFLPLCAANLLIFTVLWIFRQESTPIFARELVCASCALMLLGIPPDWVRSLLPQISRLQWCSLAAFLYLDFLCLRSTCFRAGLAGALATMCLASFALPNWSIHASLQAGLVLFLLQSFRWLETDSPRFKFGRLLVASAYLADAILWTWTAGWKETFYVSTGALGLLLAWALAWVVRRHPPSILYPVAACLALLSGPANLFGRNSSEGLITLAGSLVLFAIGLVVAWTKHRWQPSPLPELQNRFQPVPQAKPSRLP